MKIVIATQYCENYGAHDWDGKGQCPQYWKNKGGDIYIIENLTQEEANDFIQNKITDLYSMIEYSHEAAQEYVISTQVLENNALTHDEWETPYIVTMSGDKFNVSRVIKNDEYGYMNKKVSEKHENYFMKAQGGRENYEVNYLLTSGQMVSSKNIEQYLN